MTTPNPESPDATRDLQVASELRCTTTPAEGPLQTGPAHGGPASRAPSLFASPRRSLLGWGEAMRIHLPAPWTDHVHRVAEVLAAIPTEDDVVTVGTGPLAMGALPFDRDAAAELVVPAEMHGLDAEGRRWVTRITGGAAATEPVGDGSRQMPPESHPRTQAVDAPRSIQVRASLSAEEWCAMVEEATGRLRAGELTKVVLARGLELEADSDFDSLSLWHSLRRSHPTSLTFCIDGFVGASPELLVSRVGSVVRAHPMAGTTARTGEAEADQRRAGELLASDKNRVEHQITIDMVHDTLLPWCSFLDAEAAPSVVPAGPVQHLASLVEGQLSDPVPSVLDLVAALHPTPAVGGWPRAEALQLINELEATGRGRYAGPVGWMDASGNGVWAVGIRSAELTGTTARMFAGVGVVADSDPLAELEETRAKAQALLGPLLRL